jgi:hypothetical protein
MAIELNGDFIKIQKTTIKISEIISIKPQSIVQVNYAGQIIARDVPKIIIRTNHDYHELMYASDEQRDEELRNLNEEIGKYNVKKEKADNGKNTTINISGSTGVNVVSDSTNVTINQEIRKEAQAVVDKLLQEVKKLQDVDTEIKEDIQNAVLDLKDKIDSGKDVPRFSFRALLGMTSDIATLGGLTISLGQILGFIPK